MLTKSQAIQALNEITGVAFLSEVQGRVHARCQLLSRELTKWIELQKTDSEPEAEPSADKPADTNDNNDNYKKEVKLLGEPA